MINAIKFAIEEIEASDQYFDHTTIGGHRRYHANQRFVRDLSVGVKRVRL